MVVMITTEEYKELTLKAWKYDKLREKEINGDFYISREIDLYEPTAEEKAAIEEKRKTITEGLKGGL